jgi:hypothetical protein
LCGIGSTSILDRNTIHEIDSKGCCHDGVAQLVDLICHSDSNAADAGSETVKRRLIVDKVARACLEPPGMTEEELTEMILAEWNVLR